ncbi:transcriptional regulator TbsP [Salinigranum sp. GCM10025319]|uniref:transcriptional regulator TbsP n=1 Tax=Salinigranum sp. GCM10025319 TaxID=3252687 RepID=UPI0036189CC6
MPVDSNLLAKGLDDILQTVLSECSEGLLVVNPTADTIEALVSVATAFDGDLPVVRVVADGSLLKDVVDDFIVASSAADLVDEGVLSLKVGGGNEANSLVITRDSVLALVTAGDHVAALATDDEVFVDSAYETYAAAWDEAPEFTLRTPSITVVRDSLATDISEAVRDDFDTVLSSLQTARGDGQGLDEVTISLLVAARNEVLLYDISKWGEDIGIASKATFSRTKTRLEDLGLIDTEKVPIDVGRPRLRLKLGDDRLREADVDQLADVAQRLLD